MSFSKHVSIFIFLFLIVQIDAWKRCTKLRTHLQRFNEDKPGETPITGVEKNEEEEKPIEREVVMNLYFSTTISKVQNGQSIWTISDMKFDSINKTMYYPLCLTMIGCHPEICLYGDNKECKFICLAAEPYNEVKYTEDSNTFDIEVMLYPPLPRTDFRHFRETGLFNMVSIRKFKDYLIKYTSIINQEDLKKIWDNGIWIDAILMSRQLLIANLMKKSKNLKCFMVIRKYSKGFSIRDQKENARVTQ
uniref:Uncharacterized protein n=1 Tax=Acrobeloides nanus TaxID=290746 RepID=A0A914DAS9_9BILA